MDPTFLEYAENLLTAGAVGGVSGAAAMAIAAIRPKIVTVTQYTARIVKIRGKHRTLTDPKVHILWGGVFVEVSQEINLANRVHTVTFQARTPDGAYSNMTANIGYRVINPEIYYLGFADRTKNIENAVEDEFTDRMGKTGLAEYFFSKDVVKRDIEEALQRKLGPIGISVESVSVKVPEPSVAMKARYDRMTAAHDRFVEDAISAAGTQKSIEALTKLGVELNLATKIVADREKEKIRADALQGLGGKAKVKIRPEPAS